MKKACNSAKLTLLNFSILSLLPLAVNAWELKGKWSTAVFNCQGSSVAISVEMNSRIGGSDAAPVRPAYLIIDGNRFDSVWIVGATMNTVSSNNRSHELVLGNSGIYLDLNGYPRRVCVSN